MVTVLTRDDFARHNYFSLSDVLERAVGIDVSREGYRGTRSTARLRGLSSPQSLVIAVDGRPVTHAFDGEVDVSVIPLNMVERIEVTRGGSSVLYGPSAAGVVNIVPGRPTIKNWLVDLETGVGRDGVRQHNGRFFNRFWAGDLSYIGGRQDSGGFTRNDQSELTSHFLNFTRSFKSGGYWGLEYSYIDGFSGTPDGTAVPFELWNGKEERVPINSTGRRDHEQQVIRLLTASPPVADGTFYADFTQHLRDSEIFTAPSGGIALEDEDNDSVEGRLRYERKGSIVGVEGKDFDRDSQNEPSREATQSGAFAQTRVNLGELELAPGVRYDDHSRAGGGLSARIATIFRPVDTTAFSASYQKGSRFPTFDELFPTSGAPLSLDPEFVSTVDAGVVYEGTGYRAAITAFDTRVTDAIAFDGAAGTFKNSAEDKTRGVELEAAVSAGTGVWREVRLSGNFTARDARRKDAGASSFGEAPLAPKRLASARLENRLPWNIRMTNEMRYESEQFETTGRSGRRLPPFAIWNLRFDVHIHSAVVYLAAENLGARRYAEAFGSVAGPPGTGLAPQPTRTFWTGLSVRFYD